MNLNKEVYNINLINQIKYFYFLGIFLSIILTSCSFLLIFLGWFSKEITIFFILVGFLLQIFVHFRYFFNINKLNYDIWSMVFMIFTLIVVFIIISGSIWIMYNLNHHFIID
ncbi:Cytochrome bo(3) ubiquinol oxidase subunit 4 [Buchnera aphidicola (Eriosoma lanigerum)]|uniref:cytochrome o ubiquinol oxidase subunit IV n=1 Tax=Buchnera aphidicola TaxID=9 RepID=UPI0034643E76